MLARYMLSSCVCPSVRLSIRPSHVGIVTKTAKHKITQTTPYANGLYFSDAKNVGEIPTGSPPTGRQIEEDRFGSAVFDQYLAISQKRNVKKHPRCFHATGGLLNSL